MSSILSFFMLFFCIHIYAEGARFRCDYTYFQQAGGWFKLHDKLSHWARAKQTCLYEGGDLAAPVSDEISIVMLALINTSSVAPAVHTDVLYYGDNNVIEYLSDSEVWIMKSDGSFERKQEGNFYPFICYKRAEAAVELNECGTVDDGYTLDSRTGQCYKFHSNRSTWRHARFSCNAEGANLAVINSDDEAQAIVDLFARHPSESIAGDAWRDSAFLGFQKLRRDKWITLNGDSLSNAGYANWSPGEPNNARGDEYCGSVGRNGKLFDDPCLRRLPFVCEKKIDSLFVC